MGNKNYTEEEIQFLIEKFPIHGINYCAKYLNKTKNSIRAKVFRLKLKKRKNTKEEKKEAKKLGDKKWRDANSKKISENGKKWRKANPEKKKKQTIDWYIKNPEYNKQWRYANPEKVAWRRVLKNSFRRFGKKKEGHTIDLLGYSALDLYNHMINLFTDGMSWENYGEWHVDHIKPVLSFDKDTHPSIVNALSNLRPLWATSRIINGVFYEGNLNRTKY